MQTRQTGLLDLDPGFSSLTARLYFNSDDFSYSCLTQVIEVFLISRTWPYTVAFAFWPLMISKPGKYPSDFDWTSFFWILLREDSATPSGQQFYRLGGSLALGFSRLFIFIWLFRSSPISRKFCSYICLLRITSHVPEVSVILFCVICYLCSLTFKHYPQNSESNGPRYFRI